MGQDPFLPPMAAILPACLVRKATPIHSNTREPWSTDPSTIPLDTQDLAATLLHPARRRKTHSLLMDMPTLKAISSPIPSTHR